MALRFISDIHLEANRPLITRAFLSYLTELPKDTEALYLLGDIFDAWVGDDDDDAFTVNIRAEIKALVSRGTPVFIMRGNRDFLIGKQFAQETGCQLLDDPTVIHYKQQDYLLCHGDSLCTDDASYQAFRQQIQSPATQAMLMCKTLAERREIAKQLRNQSGMANSNKAQDIMDVNKQAVDALMQEHNVAFLIHGHTHRPAIHNLADNKKRIVLGDWETNGWELILDEQLTLHSFPIE